MKLTYAIFADRPIAHKDRSPFLVSDDRSPKMKQRSPFTPNTKHCDHCTECDRPSRIKIDRTTYKNFW